MEEKTVNLSLTSKESIMLHIFIQYLTNFRRKERDTWEKLSREKNEDGSPMFQNAEGNLKFWNDLEVLLQDIVRRLEA